MTLVDELTKWRIAHKARKKSGDIPKTRLASKHTKDKDILVSPFEVLDEYGARKKKRLQELMEDYYSDIKEAVEKGTMPVTLFSSTEQEESINNEFRERACSYFTKHNLKIKEQELSLVPVLRNALNLPLKVWANRGIMQDKISSQIIQNEDVKQDDIEKSLDEYLQNLNFRPKETEFNTSKRMEQAIDIFRKATRERIILQHTTTSMDTDEYGLNNRRLQVQYHDLIDLCSETEADIPNERIRWMLLLGAYESLSDVHILSRDIKRWEKDKAIQDYKTLKIYTNEFIEWAIAQGLDNKDIREARRILFSTYMALSSLYILKKEFKTSCREIESALELMRTFTNPKGIDYSDFIPFFLRDIDYLTTRFADGKRVNKERPYKLRKTMFERDIEEILEETSKGRKYEIDMTYTTLPEYMHKFLESIKERRIISNSLWGIIADYGQFDNRFKTVYFSDKPKLIISERANEEGKESCIEDMLITLAIDPLNMGSYRLLSGLRDNNGRKLFPELEEVYKHILLKKAVERTFDMTQVNPKYPCVVTADMRYIIKQEKDEETALKHKNLITFLLENSGLLIPSCELYRYNNNNFVLLDMITDSKGMSQEGFRACSLEDIGMLYYYEISRIEEPTIQYLSKFRKNKLMQGIDAMIKFNFADKGDKNLPKAYGLNIREYEYETEIKEKILKRVTLDEKLQAKAIKLAQDLGKLERSLSHCDFHPGNVLIIGKDEVVIIDPISTAYANRFFDLAYLLEQAEMSLSREDKSELIDYFVEQLKEKGEKIVNPQQAYDQNAAFVNLKLAGVCEKWAKEGKGEEYLKRKEVYLTRFNELIGQL